MSTQIIYKFIVCMYACGHVLNLSTGVVVIWQLAEDASSFHYVGAGDQTQIFLFGGKCPLAHLTGP